MLKTSKDNNKLLGVVNIERYHFRGEGVRGYLAYHILYL